MNHYMGVDIGTSGCKAVIFDENGNQVSAAYRDYNVITRNPGWAELDSNEVMRKCFEVIAEAANQTANDSVRGLGISSQGEAFTPVDETGKAIGGGFVSSDMRAVDYIPRFSESFGQEELYRITGHTPHPLFSLFKLLWLRDNQPTIWTKAAKFLCYEDLLQQRLGLTPRISWSLAGRTMLFDVRKHEWSPKILEAVGLSSHQLAQPVASGSVVGKIKPSIARQLGLGNDVFVVSGGHDQTCGALGAGVTKSGVAAYTTGTVECITPAYSQPTFSDEMRVNNLCTYDYTIAGMYTSIVYSLTGGNILKWFRDEFGAEELRKAEELGCDAYELLLNQVGETPSSLTVLPYFSPSGTPHFDTDTAGAILGLRLSTTRGEFIRALLEGVAFEMRLNLDILRRTGAEVMELRATGGGAQSSTWMQLKADVIGKPITVLNVTESACLGVAILARAAETGESIVDLANRWSRPVEVKQPKEEFVEHYSNKYAEYELLYSRLREIGTLARQTRFEPSS